MTYRSRSSRLPTLSHHDTDTYVYDTFDTYAHGGGGGGGATAEMRPRSVSRQSASINSRNYIDPWDLENYAYIQRNMESSEDSRIPSPAGEPMSSSAFYYVSNNVPDECPCYAGLDEQLFHNAKYEMIPDDFAYSTYTDVETSSTERNSSCSGGSSVSTLQLHTPGFGVQSHRSIVLPKPMPHIEFPAPPPPMSSLSYHDPSPFQPSSAYEYYANVSIPAYQSAASLAAQQHHLNNRRHRPMPQRRSSSQCYECIDDHMPLYGSNSMMAEKRMHRRASYSMYGSTSGGYATIEQPNTHLERFGLSKKGLLQIDYSCNWNNLQRLIASK